MEENRLYLRDLECFQKEMSKNQKVADEKRYFDLEDVPAEKMQEELKQYLLHRGQTVSCNTIQHDYTYYRRLVHFLKDREIGQANSFLDKPQERWLKRYKGWLMQQGYPITCEKVSIYHTKSMVDTPHIRFLRTFLKFLEPEDKRQEVEKDIWRLDKLPFEIKGNPIYRVQTINFEKISQPDIKEEIKKIIYMNLQYEAVGTVQSEMSVMRDFTAYLKKEYPQISSMQEVNREILESYLIYQKTEKETYRGNSNRILKLRNVITGIGKLYGYGHLENLFLNTDIPPEVQPEFKVYSDEEMKRLNAHIIKLDEQIGRWLIIHQMLGTRVSDTSTLKQDCLYQENGQNMIRIEQVKTRIYQKPISGELAMLIQKAIRYTQDTYGTTEYVFVNAEDPMRPLQYTTIKHKIINMINKEELKDDKGETFRFGTHLFRHYYGVKLTEMHLDDWTIARLLGHKKLGSVQHYRKMSNQKLADETREIRTMMSDIIYDILDGWGGEYEQIRQNDRRK